MEKLGYKPTAVQCQNKWQYLLNKYKKICDHNKQTGEAHLTMAEYNFIGDVIGDKPSVKPPCVFSSLKKEFALGEGKNVHLNT